jgi:hypothetical protein
VTASPFRPRRLRMAAQSSQTTELINAISLRSVSVQHHCVAMSALAQLPTYRSVAVSEVVGHFRTHAPQEAARLAS